MDISRMKFCLDNAEHQIKIQETHINRTGRAPCNDLRWIQSVYDRLTDGPPKTTDAAVQTTASGECGFTLPSQPAKVVHGTQAYNDELIEAWRSSQRSCVISCPSRTSSVRQIGDIYEYTSLAYRASKTRKVPPLPPPRCRAAATAFRLACAWHRASRRTRRGTARPEIAESKSATASVSA